ncbi:MAG: hypothetical protein RBU35_11975 [Anaerolineae bacterium]|jgi:chromosome segregation ATPase|nr:hypothetical protein [Anaerolineae bacterium]
MTQESAEVRPDEHSIAEVDRIRDIIFGSQMRSYEQQFKRVAWQLEQISKQLEELRASLNRQRADLEGQTLKLQEATEQAQKDMERTLSKQIAQLRAGMDKQGADLGTQLRDQVAELSRKDEALRSEFINAFDSLEAEKTSRGHLGDLLVEMGTRLKQQADLTDLLGQLAQAPAEQTK